jgi:hypothetical protein
MILIWAYVSYTGTDPESETVVMFMGTAGLFAVLLTLAILKELLIGVIRGMGGGGMLDKIPTLWTRRTPYEQRMLSCLGLFLFSFLCVIGTLISMQGSIAIFGEELIALILKLYTYSAFLFGIPSALYILGYPWVIAKARLIRNMEASEDS